VGPGSPSHPVLADGMTIVGIDSGDIFEELRQQAPEIMLSLAESVRIINQFLSDLNQNRKITDAITDLASIIHTVQESITSGQGDLRATAQNMRQFSEHLNTSLDQFDETLTEVRGELRSTSEDLSRTLADLRTGSDERLEQAGQILDRVDRAVGIFEDYANTNAPRWAAITSDVESVADQLDRLLSRLESGEGTLGLIVHDEALYREMTAAFAAFNLWIGRIGDWLSGIEQPVAVRTVPYDLTARGASPSPSEQ
jgi:phospholipid/cholesterol/gamma-HCH transport system substrate-binding protein